MIECIYDKQNKKCLFIIPGDFLVPTDLMPSSFNTKNRRRDGRGVKYVRID